MINLQLNRPSCNPVSFNGYIACPLHSLYLQAPKHGIEDVFSVAEELEDVGKVEGFDVFVQVGDKIFKSLNEITDSIKYNFWESPDFSGLMRWSQDTKVFLEENLLGIIDKRGQGAKSEANLAKKLADTLQINHKEIKLKSMLAGGNFFLGLSDKGEKLAIVGKDSLYYAASVLFTENHPDMTIGEVFGQDTLKKAFVNMYAEEFFINDDFIDNEAKRYFNKKLGGLKFEELIKELFTIKDPLLGNKGLKEEYLEKGKKYIGQDLNINPEQISFISQHDYHLDTYIRPLQYPFILLNSNDCYTDIINYLEKTENNASKYLETCKIIKESYASIPHIEKELADAGFQVIKIPGVRKCYSKHEEITTNPASIRADANYINAIVHQKPDGSLIYITNSCDPCLDERFKNCLQEKVPSIKQVYFISGKICSNGQSFIKRGLEIERGGIHCMVAELPDFNLWKKLLFKLK